MTLTTSIVIGIAVFIGFIVAGCIIAAKKYPNRDEVLADLIAEQVRKDPLPAVYYSYVPRIGFMNKKIIVI